MLFICLLLYNNFEGSHLILKNRENLDNTDYVYMFYELLYNGYSIENAKQMVIEEFNKKALCKSKKNKPNV